MARPAIGLDWAASGLKLVLRCGVDLTCHGLPWPGDSVPPPGEGDSSPLRAMVSAKKWEGTRACVAIHRRHVLLFSCRRSDVAAEIERLLPLPLAGWRWNFLATDAAPPLVVAVEARRVRALKAFVESCGLRWGGLVFVADSHGLNVMTVDVGHAEAQVIHRRSDGELQWRRVPRDGARVASVALASNTQTIHLSGGGSGTDFVAALRDHWRGELIPAGSETDARYRIARAAAEGTGIVIDEGRDRRAESATRWSRALAFAAASTAVASTAAVSRSARSPMVLSVGLRIPAPRLDEASVIDRALATVPVDLKLTDFRFDAGTSRISWEGMAPSQKGADELVARLSAAGFSQARCLKLALDDRRRVHFNVVAAYEH